MAEINLITSLSGGPEVVAGLKQIEGAVRAVGAAAPAALKPAAEGAQKLVAPLKQSAPALDALQHAIRRTVGPLTGLALGMGSGESAIKSLLTAGTGLAAFIGGPWTFAIGAGGAALLALADGLGAFESSAAQAEAAAESYTAAMDALAKAVDDTVTSQKRAGAAAVEAAQQQIEASLTTQRALLATLEAQQLSLAAAGRGSAEFRAELGALALQIDQVQARILALTGSAAQLGNSFANMPRGSILNFRASGGAAGEQRDPKADGFAAAQREAEQAAAKLAERLADVNSGLRQQIDALHMTEEQAAALVAITKAGVEVNSEAADGIRDLVHQLFAAKAATADFNKELEREQALHDEIAKIIADLRTPMQVYADEMEHLGELVRNGLDPDLAEQWGERLNEVLKNSSAGVKHLGNETDELGDLVRGSFDRIGDAISDSMTRGGNAMSALRDIGLTVVGDLTEAFLKLSVINPLLNGLGLGGSGGGLPTLSGILGGLIGGGGVGGAAGVPRTAPLIHPMATGGDRVFSRPSLVLVGENAPERVRVGPLGAHDDREAGATFIINVNGGSGDDHIVTLVKRGIEQATPHIVKKSVTAVKDKRNRDPGFLGRFVGGG